MKITMKLGALALALSCRGRAFCGTDACEFPS